MALKAQRDMVADFTPGRAAGSGHASRQETSCAPLSRDDASRPTHPPPAGPHANSRRFTCCSKKSPKGLSLSPPIAFSRLFSPWLRRISVLRYASPGNSPATCQGFPLLFFSPHPLTGALDAPLASLSHTDTSGGDTIAKRDKSRHLARIPTVTQSHSVCQPSR